MNDRIRQLAEQANIHFSRLGILDGDPDGIAKFVSYSKMEKFAELIIKECAEIALKDATPEWDWTEANTQSKKIATDLKEHFGVAE